MQSEHPTEVLEHELRDTSSPPALDEELSSQHEDSQQPTQSP